MYPIDMLRCVRQITYTDKPIMNYAVFIDGTGYV